MARNLSQSAALATSAFTGLLSGVKFVAGGLMSGAAWCWCLGVRGAIRADTVLGINEARKVSKFSMLAGTEVLFDCFYC